MITSWDIYWLTRLNPIGNTISIVAALSAIGSVFIVGGAIASSSCDSPSERTAHKVLKRVSFIIVPILLLATTINVLLPNMKEMAAIIVVPKVINAVAQNEDFKQIPTNIVELANEWLKELKPKSK